MINCTDYNSIDAKLGVIKIVKTKRTLKIKPNSYVYVSVYVNLPSMS